MIKNEILKLSAPRETFVFVFVEGYYEKCQHPYIAEGAWHGCPVGHSVDEEAGDEAYGEEAHDLVVVACIAAQYGLDFIETAAEKE